MILEDGKCLFMSKEEGIKLATRILQAVGEIEGGKVAVSTVKEVAVSPMKGTKMFCVSNFRFHVVKSLDDIDF